MSNWESHEDAVLIKMVLHEGASYSEVADEIAGRTAESVRKRWNRIKNMVYVTPNKPVDNFAKVFLNAVVFDIEVMDFNSVGIGGHLVCCSFLPLTSDEPYTKVLKFSDARNDQALLTDILTELEKYDILIGHYIAGFDLNWLHSRAMYYGMRMPKSWVYYDTYHVAKAMAIKTQKSLGALGAYFGADGEKTRVFEADWSMVDSPIKAEFDHAVELIGHHCEQDVSLNREVFNILWKYDKNKARSLKDTKW